MFDLETTSLDVLIAEVVGLSFSWKENEAFYLPVIAPDENISLNLEEVIEILKPVFENESIGKCAHNAKYDLMVLDKYDVSLKGL